MPQSSRCHKFYLKKVDLEQKRRKVCKNCGFVDYKNPKIVTGSIVVKNKKILLCKRAISPGYGKWTFPSGYLDQNETPEEGAIREAKEEVNIKIKLQKLLMIFTVRRKNLVQFVFLAKHLNNTFKPGIETIEAKYFDYKDLPWKTLAFPSVQYALKKISKLPNNLPIFYSFNKD